jgi:hypothetical protein
MSAQTSSVASKRKTATKTSSSARKPVMKRTSAEAPPSHPSKRSFDGPEREEFIRRRAYAFYQDRGGVDGGAVDDWLAAEAEVDRATLEGAGPLSSVV